jgi:hypothetical protein
VIYLVAPFTKRGGATALTLIFPGTVPGSFAGAVGRYPGYWRLLQLPRAKLLALDRAAEGSSFGPRHRVEAAAACSQSVSRRSRRRRFLSEEWHTASLAWPRRQWQEVMKGPAALCYAVLKF